jgi:hypothetical protein
MQFLIALAGVFLASSDAGSYVTKAFASLGYFVENPNIVCQ